MKNDPAIEEVRRARIELSRKLENDPKKFLEYFTRLQEQMKAEGKHTFVEKAKLAS